MLHALTSETKRRGMGNSFARAAASTDRPVVDRPVSDRQSPLAALHPAYGNQVILRFLRSTQFDAGQGRSSGVLQRKCACGNTGGDCAECKKKETGVQRKPASANAASAVPPIVHDVLRSPGRPLDASTRAFFEPRFGHDFGNVRIHTDSQAANSAHAVNALAYTVGRDVVFDQGRYHPRSDDGQRLLAHELAHVVQQGVRGARPTMIGPLTDSRERDAEQAANRVVGGNSGRYETQTEISGTLRRTPAKKVSCAPGPLHLPGGGVVDDPVGVITAAENRANQLLDQAIAELDFTRQRILGGAAVGWPTISDALGTGLRLMGLDPNSDRVWKQKGGPANYTAELLLRRLRSIRGTIGRGNFFFTCLGPQNGTIGSCVGPICAGGNFCVSCAGSFLIDFCEPFWTHGPEDQAARIIHESAHNFAEFIGAHGEIGRRADIAECYARFAQVVGGINIANQRTDLCPDPT